MKGCCWRHMCCCWPVGVKPVCPLLLISIEVKGPGGGGTGACWVGGGRFTAGGGTGREGRYFMDSKNVSLCQSLKLSLGTSLHTDDSQAAQLTRGLASSGSTSSLN